MRADVVQVSVVIPCYCCEQTLERAVASVAGQTAQPLELILVDDGNTEESRNILVKLRDLYAPGWIKLVLLEKNVGAASARNAGWDQASGRFVAFLDADDSWHPHKLELQYQFMLSEPDVAVSGHGHTQLGKAGVSGRLGKHRFRSLSRFHVLLKNPFITPSFMVRRDLVFRFLAGRRHMEDHLFLMQVADSGLRVAKTDLPLAFIYKHIYGDAGLSADMWTMQESELKNYQLLYREGGISSVTLFLFQVYSWVKFCRRVVLVKFRRLFRDYH